MFASSYLSSTDDSEEDDDISKYRNPSPPPGYFTEFPQASSSTDQHVYPHLPLYSASDGTQLLNGGCEPQALNGGGDYQSICNSNKRKLKPKPEDVTKKIKGDIESECKLKTLRLSQINTDASYLSSEHQSFITNTANSHIARDHIYNDNPVPVREISTGFLSSVQANQLIDTYKSEKINPMKASPVTDISEEQFDACYEVEGETGTKNNENATQNGNSKASLFSNDEVMPVLESGKNSRFLVPEKIQQKSPERNQEKASDCVVIDMVIDSNDDDDIVNEVSGDEEISVLQIIKPNKLINKDICEKQPISTPSIASGSNSSKIDKNPDLIFKTGTGVKKNKVWCDSKVLETNSSKNFKLVGTPALTVIETEIDAMPTATVTSHQLSEQDTESLSVQRKTASSFKGSKADSKEVSVIVESNNRFVPDMIDAITQRIDFPCIGLDFVYEVQRTKILLDIVFMCRLCKAKCSDITILKHLNGFKHHLNCLKRFSPLGYERFRNRGAESVQVELKIFIKRLEMLLGRGKMTLKPKVDSSGSESDDVSTSFSKKASPDVIASNYSSIRKKKQGFYPKNGETSSEYYERLPKEYKRDLVPSTSKSESKVEAFQKEVVVNDSSWYEEFLPKTLMADRPGSKIDDASTSHSKQASPNAIVSNNSSSRNKKQANHPKNLDTSSRFYESLPRAYKRDLAPSTSKSELKVNACQKEVVVNNSSWYKEFLPKKSMAECPGSKIDDASTSHSKQASPDAIVSNYSSSRNKKQGYYPKNLDTSSGYYERLPKAYKRDLGPSASKSQSKVRACMKEVVVNDSSWYKEVLPDTAMADFYCRVCDSHMVASQVTWDAHIAGKKHRKNLKKPPEKRPRHLRAVLTSTVTPLLKKDLDINDVIVGLDHVSENQNKLYGIGAMYRCYLCSGSYTKTTIIEHLISTKHRLKYIQRVDPDNYELFAKFDLSPYAFNSFVQDAALKLENKYGRGRIEVRLK